MPHAPTTPKRARRKKPRALVSAAVSIPEVLYEKALKVADSKTEGNFSRYIRDLINKDLAQSADGLPA